MTRANDRGQRQQAMTRPFILALVGGAIVIAAIALSFLGDTDEGEQAAVPPAGAPATAPSAQISPETTPSPETASSSEAAPSAQTAPSPENAPSAQTAPPSETAPSPEAAPSAQTAPPSETAAAAPAKPGLDIVRIDPQGDTATAGRAEPGARIQTPDGDKDEGEQASAAPADVQAPAPSAKTAPSPETAPSAQMSPGTAPPSETASPPETAPSAQTASPPETASSAETAPPSGTAAAGPAKPSFDIVRINPRGDTVMAGRAEPGARVQILDGDKILGEGTADARGEWVFVPAAPLPPGDRQLSLRTVEAGDRPVITSDSNVVLVVPEKGKDIAGRPSEEPSQPLALKVPSEGGGATEVLQKPTPPAPAAYTPSITIDAVDYDDRGRLNVSGTGAPDGQVHLYLNNEFLGRSPTGADGRWRQSPERTVAPGVYSVRADQVDDAGKVLARIEVIFARSTQLIDVPPGTLFVVQPGNSLWRIARRTYGRGVRFTVIFEANKKQIREADLIYPGQVFRLPSIN